MAKASIPTPCSKRRSGSRQVSGSAASSCSPTSSRTSRSSGRRRCVAVKTNGTDAPTGVRFERIQQLRAHEYVAEQIRRHISLRLIRPGEVLQSERELAATFGVGRPTIQHALRLLEADRLVQARRGRNGGTFVSEPAGGGGAMEDLLARVLRRRTEIEEALAYRGLIEPRVAREAARLRRSGDLGAMSTA